MTGHIVISRGSVKNEEDCVIIEYEPPHGQPVRLGTISHADALSDRHVIPIRITCEEGCAE